MNRVVLLLNVIILVVNFLLSLSATDSQIGLMRTTAGLTTGGKTALRRSYSTRDPSLAYLRVIQALDSFAPREALDRLTIERLQTIYDAVDGYYRTVGTIVATSLQQATDADKLRREYASLGAQARAEVEQTLASSFGDRALVSRLATEIIKQCR
jgi:hypothetical protein